MTKRISVWVLIGAIIVTSAVTFMTTLLFGSSLVSASETAVEQTEALEAAQRKLTANEITSKLTAKIRELVIYYDRYYVGEIDVDKLVEGVAEGLVAYSGDKYGDYHPKEEYEAFNTKYSGEFAGIGVSVTYDAEHGAIEVLGVIDGGSALDAGILPNDLIIAVNGEAVAYLGYNQAVENIRGENGSTLTLTIARGENYSQRLEITLERRMISSQSVSYEEISIEEQNEPIGYIRVKEFTNTTYEQFRDAVSESITNNVYGLIIDLRNNGGGSYQFIAQLDGETIFKEFVEQVRLYKLRHHGNTPW